MTAHRGVTTLLATGVLAAVLATPAAAADTAADTVCPVSQMTKVWYGGAQDSWSFDACGDLTDRYDHLFYPGRMFNRSLQGRYDETVVVLQLRLRDLDYRPLAVDGDYGPQTAGAVARYQRNNGLVVDGTVGPRTWRELFGLGPA